MRKLADAGAQLALPVVAGRGKPLIMRAYAFGDALDAGVWGIREPKAGSAGGRSRHPDRAARSPSTAPATASATAPAITT